MTDVATYCRWKFIVDGIVRILIGLIGFFIAWVLVVSIQNAVRRSGGSTQGEFAALIPIFFGYIAFASGVRRIHSACLRDCWLRAGPQGISFRLPHKVRWRTLLLTYRVAQHTFAWPEIQRTYEVQYRVNGMPFGQALCMATSGGRFNFGGYFSEPPALILKCIQEARKGGSAPG